MRNNADSLGVLRVLFFGYAFVHLAAIDFTAWAQVPPVFWKPILLFRLLPFANPPSYEALLALKWIWRVSVALSCVGLFTRLATPVAAIAGLYLLGLPHNYGKIHHSDAAFVTVLLIFALSRCGDAWSLDRRIGRVTMPAAWRFEYVWPVVAIRSVLALALFSAGVSKLRHGGLAWISSESFSLVLSEYVSLNARPYLASVALWIAASPILSVGCAAVTVLTELLNPLALMSRAARLVLIPSTVLMLVGFRVLMGISFTPLIVLQLAWVDWSWVLEKVRQRNLAWRGR